MKKIFTLGLILATTTISGANASWLERLGFGKKSEPATLEEACNKDDLTAICPEMLVGSQTMMGCLTDNISSLSKKCANYVKKYVVEHKDEVVETATDTVTAAKDEVVTTKEEAKTFAKEIKESAKQAGKELKATGKELKETGKSIKESF
ncbi:MAG: hypothetical protein J5742_03980 [Alphaproteobacteria bacterium]|nr:hypothetical protein [Alphaproteobacteria bacterium]